MAQNEALRDIVNMDNVVFGWATILTHNSELSCFILVIKDYVYINITLDVYHKYYMYIFLIYMNFT